MVRKGLRDLGSWLVDCSCQVINRGFPRRRVAKFKQNVLSRGITAEWERKR